MREDIRTYPAATKEGAYLAALSIVNTTGARAAVVDERQNRESLGRWIATNDPALIEYEMSRPLAGATAGSP